MCRARRAWREGEVATTSGEASELLAATLRGDRIARSGCFVSNIAGGQLKDLGPAAAPVLEAYMSDVVRPAAAAAATPHDLGRATPDIAYVWGAYYGAVGGDRMLEFLRTGGPVLRAAGVIYSQSEWLRSDSPPDRAVLEMLADVVADESPTSKWAARQLAALTAKWRMQPLAVPA